MQKENETFCSVCGFTMPREHIGARLDCEGVNFISRTYVECELIICEECWRKTMAIDDGGMAKAIKQSESLEVQNEQTKNR